MGKNVVGEMEHEHFYSHVRKAERAVIEAAKAWQKGERAVVCDIGQDEYERFYPTELVDLLVALEALEKGE